MNTINIDKLFIFDQLEFQNILLNRKDTFDWWSQLNNFIVSSRNKLYFPHIKEKKTCVIRTKIGKIKIPITRFEYKNKSFIHPFYQQLVQSNNEQKFEEAIELFKNGLSQKAIATKIYNNAFNYTTLGKRLKKKQIK